MFSRRGILGLFSGLLSWFAAKKVVAEPVVELQTLDHVLPEGFIPLPDWWAMIVLNCMGHKFETSTCSNMQRRISLCSRCP